MKDPPKDPPRDPKEKDMERASASRMPALSAYGRILLSLSMVLLILGAGAGSPPLSACGLALLCGILSLYLAFLPVAVLVWRRYLELLWWVKRPEGTQGETSEGLLSGRPFVLTVTLRNLGPLPMGQAILRVFSSRCIEICGQTPCLTLPKRTEVTCQIELLAAQAGQWFLHGAAVELKDPLGLFVLQAYFPSSTPLKVLPRPGAHKALPPMRRALGAPDERLGVHTLRHRGIGGELRELRDYVPGDPFKLIAWKASARAPLSRLLVRDLDREILITHTILLDMGASMREGPRGHWKLDHALTLVLSYVRSVLDGGDSVGLITFDDAVYSRVKESSGTVVRLQIIEKLLSLMNVTDEQFSGVSDAEVCAAVARYLRQQEGLEGRIVIPPPIDDAQAWAGLSVSATGEIYDLRKLAGAARRLLSGEPVLLSSSGDSGQRAQDQSHQLLREFCQRRGIELPYRRKANRVKGLAQALTQVSATRQSRRVLLISDLDGLGKGRSDLQAAIALLRRRGHHLTCLFPESRRYLPQSLLAERPASRAATIFGWEVRRREQEAQAALSRMGVSVVPVGPEDGLAQILERMSANKVAPSAARQT